MNKKYIKNCPKCNKIRYYKREYDVDQAVKNKTLCDHCSALEREKKKKESLTEEDIKQKKEKRKIYEQEYYQKNKKRHRKNAKIWRKNNPEKNAKYWKKYSHTEKYKAKRNKKLAILRQDPLFRIKENMSRNMRKSLKRQRFNKNGRHWEDIVGYTVQELKEHLEKLFLPGMSWDNYGEWHIDHIVPKSFFKYNNLNDVEFKYCWSLHNLQPLWAKDNIRKGNKIGHKKSPSLLCNEELI